jgi:hypothetical protein
MHRTRVGDHLQWLTAFLLDVADEQHMRSDSSSSLDGQLSHDRRVGDNRKAEAF